MKKVIVSLSGGMDSITLASFYLSKGYEVYPVSFFYGSKHNVHELIAAESFCKKNNLQFKKINLPFIEQLFKSDLLKTGGEIPEGYYTTPNMSQTVVPGRNIIFASIMAGYAWSIGANIISLGVHAGDHTIYEDCRPEFIAAMNAAIVCGSGNRVYIETPFLNINKTEILKIGLDIGVDYKSTRTCYKDQILACGKCGSCQERLEAFKTLEIKDPVEYEK